MLTAAFAFPQTRLIAHKSHSGGPLDHDSYAGYGNFGNPPPRLKIIEKVNDTTVVLRSEEWPGATPMIEDTVYNDPILSDPNIPVDSMRKTQRNGAHIEFKNFEKKEEVAPPEPTKEIPPNDRPVQDKKKGRKPTKSGIGPTWLIGSLFFGYLLTSFLYRRLVPARRV
jgi:hypothetical protein